MNIVFTKKLATALFAFSTLALIAGCTSNTGYHQYNINQAFEKMPSDVKAKTDDFKYYFGQNSAPYFSKKLGPISTSNRTNAVAKEPVISCNWVFYSALIDMKIQAQKLGGNAVGNIQSNWQGIANNSNTTYVCENGLLMSGVAFKGDALKI
ncbi:hypothetical protein [Fangia hongkongensis]|uniref:hypothetical protein n=1 Tax=Fangia hongkongensis TaxID=270495 RepID=UPI0003716A31|nr:hypothetical protein [Fangia hongkongensis]MBK2126302.1 excinuclease [Fangia hongkongensis]